MTAAVLDVSALLALLLREPGDDKVQGVLADCAMTAVSLGEASAISPALARVRSTFG
jgi:PIN domain nuclease of toxin-antitoxin system